MPDEAREVVFPQGNPITMLVTDGVAQAPARGIRAVHEQRLRVDRRADQVRVVRDVPRDPHHPRRRDRDRREHVAGQGVDPQRAEGAERHVGRRRRQDRHRHDAGRLRGAGRVQVERVAAADADQLGRVDLDPAALQQDVDAVVEAAGRRVAPRQVELGVAVAVEVGQRREAGLVGLDRQVAEGRVDVAAGAVVDQREVLEVRRRAGARAHAVGQHEVRAAVAVQVADRDRPGLRLEAGQVRRRRVDEGPRTVVQVEARVLDRRAAAGLHRGLEQIEVAVGVDVEQDDVGRRAPRATDRGRVAREVARAVVAPDLRTRAEQLDPVEQTEHRVEVAVAIDVAEVDAPGDGRRLAGEGRAAGVGEAAGAVAQVQAPDLVGTGGDQVVVAVTVDVADRRVGQAPRVLRRQRAGGRVDEAAAAVVDQQVRPVAEAGDVEVAVAIGVERGRRAELPDADRQAGGAVVDEPAEAVVPQQARADRAGEERVPVAVPVEVGGQQHVVVRAVAWQAPGVGEAEPAVAEVQVLADAVDVGQQQQIRVAVAVDVGQRGRAGRLARVLEAERGGPVDEHAGAVVDQHGVVAVAGDEAPRGRRQHEVDVAVAVEVAGLEADEVAPEVGGAGRALVGEGARAVVDPDQQTAAAERAGIELGDQQVGIAVAVDVGGADRTRQHRAARQAAGRREAEATLAVVAQQHDPGLRRAAGVGVRGDVDVAVAIGVERREVECTVRQPWRDRVGERARAVVEGDPREGADRVAGDQQVEVAVAVEVAERDVAGRAAVEVEVALGVVAEGAAAVVAEQPVLAAVDAGDEVDVAVAVDIAGRQGDDVADQAGRDTARGRDEAAVAGAGQEHAGPRQRVSAAAEHDVAMAVAVEVGDGHRGGAAAQVGGQRALVQLGEDRGLRAERGRDGGGEDGGEPSRSGDHVAANRCWSRIARRGGSRVAESSVGETGTGGAARTSSGFRAPPGLRSADDLPVLHPWPASVREFPPIRAALAGRRGGRGRRPEHRGDGGGLDAEGDRRAQPRAERRRGHRRASTRGLRGGRPAVGRNGHAARADRADGGPTARREDAFSRPSGARVTGRAPLRCVASCSGQCRRSQGNRRIRRGSPARPQARGRVRGGMAFRDADPHRGIAPRPEGRTSLRSVRPDALACDVVASRALTPRILACREDSPIQRPRSPRRPGATTPHREHVRPSPDRRMIGTDAADQSTLKRR
jgi:hypothetical protein